jgi:hypothetical protein
MHFHVGAAAPHILKAASFNCHIPKGFLLAKWALDNPGVFNSKGPLRSVHAKVSSRRVYLLHSTHWEVSYLPTEHLEVLPFSSVLS